MATVEIDVVSDVICPWCLIGTKHLEDALATRPDVEAKITFHPFLLDPSVPAEGADLRERLRRKYGDPRPLFARVEAVARKAGIPLDFAKVQRTPNTLAAHVLLNAAVERGTQRALVKALFEAYFLEGRDVGDPDVLASIGSSHGFEPDEVRALLGDDEARARVHEEANAAAQGGVDGVPFFVFDRKLAVGGAQPVEVFVEVLDRVAPR